MAQFFITEPVTSGFGYIVLPVVQVLLFHEHGTTATKATFILYPEILVKMPSNQMVQFVNEIGRSVKPTAPAIEDDARLPLPMVQLTVQWSAEM